MTSLMLDIQRIFSLVWVSLKYGTRPLLRRLFRLPPGTPSYGVRLRLALEELGLTYVKLGQFLTMRFDVLPVDVCRELNKLFEAASPMSYEDVRAVIEAELKRPLPEVFPVFVPEPLAAASVAQVHQAYTAGHEKVAVKVQRPGVERHFAADMRNLRRLATLIDLSGVAGAFSVREIVDEFANWTRREMDFVTEGRTAERLRANAAPYEIVPRVSWELTTEKVLTMEFIEGMSLAKIGELVDTGRLDLIGAQLPNLDLELAGRNIAFAVLRQLFVFGFFQGDPHPGNVFIRNDNKVAFVDFGIFGELTEEQRENFASFLENLAIGNINLSFRYYAKQHTPTAATDLQAFEREAKGILQRWHQASVDPNGATSARHMGKYAVEMIGVVRRHRLKTSTDNLLLWRALYALDASAERLSEYFDLMKQLRAFFLELRAGPLERMAKLAADPGRTAVLLDLLRNAPAFGGRLSGGLGRAERVWPVQTRDSKDVRRSGDRQAGWLSLGAIGVSFAVMVVAAPVSAPLTAIVFALATAVVVLLAVQAVRP